jgi:CHASE2 domain-containing sensor protein
MEGDDRFGRRWLSHWITAMLFSVIFFCVLNCFGPPFLLRALDRAGSDAVIRGYAPDVSEMDLRRYPRIVVVDLGKDPTTKIVADTLRSVAQANPKAVGLDLIVVPGLPVNPLTSGANPIGVLADALQDPKWQKPLIAIPVRSNEEPVNEELVAKIRIVKEIHPASVELRRDEDGVVRSACPDDSSRTGVPTLAEAMLNQTRCGPDHDPAILFAPVGVPQADDKPGVYIVTRETVERQPKILNDSYVLLGEAVRGVGSDRFLTPVGQLPGVMIHAQSLWTLWRDDANFWERHRECLALLLDLVTAIVAAAVFSLYPAWRDGHQLPLDSIRQALRQFAEGLVVLALMAVVLLLFGVTWTSLAVRLLGAGVVIGAMSAMFGAMLETLVHAGEYLVKPLHWLVERLMKHKMVIVVALTILCVPLAGHAADCSYKVTVTPPLSKDWTVEWGDATQPDRKEPPDPGVRLHPFDRIVVERGTSVAVQLADEPSARPMTIEGGDTDGEAALILPPCGPRGAWDRFWAAMNPRESTRSFGATLIWRGLEKGEVARQGGPLRELTTLVPAQGTVAGAKGLAFAWVGGSPPYRIAVEDEASGTPLASSRVNVAELWLPDWRTPPAPFVVIVTDEQGVSLWRHLRPLPPPSIGGDEIGDAVAMFETAPEYRLEALRRLFLRSKAGDALASRAIGVIRIAGAGP